MALGAIGAVALARLVDFMLRPSVSQLQGAGYHAAVFVLVFILSGVAAETGPRIGRPMLQVLQVVAGPLCVGLSDLWIRGWLDAPQRDRVMASVLRLSGLSLPLAGVACLALPAAVQLPSAAAISVLGGVVTLWLTARARLLGDSLAPVMAAGCLLTIPAIAGLYAIAMELPGLGLAMHASLALCAALSNAFTGFGLWRRDRHEQRVRRPATSVWQTDPVTQLHSGRSLVDQLMRAQRRRRRSGQDGAVLAVMVFNVERIRAEAGTVGINQMFICMASRMQRQVGAVNVVGRYYEGCFVALVESIQSLASLRTLGLRVASSLRRPIEITTMSGERADVRADVGVGVVHLSGRGAAVEDILDDAQQMAEAAREMQSRAAIRDPLTAQAVAVEHANLGSRHRRERDLLHAGS
jgi:GGDEF domain-containing protein